MRSKNFRTLPTDKRQALIARVFDGLKSEFRGTPQIFVEEFSGILRNTLGIPIFVPWLQGKYLNIYSPNIFIFANTKKTLQTKILKSILCLFAFYGMCLSIKF